MKKKYKSTKFTGTRHDCRRNGWGHTCYLEVDSEQIIGFGKKSKTYYRCHGHLFPRVKPGDQVIVPFGNGPMVCQFVEVENCSDPADMYFGTVEVLDYLEKLESVKTTFELSESAKIEIEGRTPESHPEQWGRGNGTKGHVLTTIHGLLTRFQKCAIIKAQSDKGGGERELATNKDL